MMNDDRVRMMVETTEDKTKTDPPPLPWTTAQKIFSTTIATIASFLFFYLHWKQNVSIQITIDPTNAVASMPIYILTMFVCLRCQQPATRRYGRLYRPPELCLGCEDKEKKRYVYMCLRCHRMASIPLASGHMKQGCILCCECRGDTPELLKEK